VGDVVTADERFAEASVLAAAAGNHEIMSISDAERALLAMDRGAWDEAARLVDHARAAIDAHGIHGYAAASLTFAAAARLALHRGDRNRAGSELARAMRARAVCTYVHPMLAVRLRLHSAIAHNAMGDPATARHLMREIDEIMAHRPRLGELVGDVARFRAVLEAAAADGATGPPLTPAELRLLPYLQTHLSAPEIGERLFVSRNTVRTEVSSIYRKLGVSSRTEAVERATVLGLLGG
jgi:LuxR family maltose regulon positive regulatory protein